MRIILNKRERKLILSRDLCRFSTINPNGWPHTVPVGYVFLHGKFYIPSLRRTKKVRNLERTAKATMVIDEERPEQGVMIEGNCNILDGDEAESYKEYLRNEKGWQNDDTTVIIEVSPLRQVSWFLK